MSDSHSRIAGTGSYLPEQVVTNAELAATVDTSDQWIRTMTGIAQRHIAGKSETTTEMAAIAATRAMRAAGVLATDIDLIVVATITPDLVFPSSAALLQARLGASHVGAFDLSAACSGFVYGLALADAMISCRKSRIALVVGSERMSTLLDWTDRSTCVLFGDGAGAAVMVGARRPGIYSTHLHADGANPDVLRAPSKHTPYLHMHGASVFKFAVRGLVEAGAEALQANHVSPNAVSLFVPHQANLRIIEAAARKLGIPDERVAITVDRHANTSAASIPLALDASVSDGKIRSGDTILLASVGGGFTWASALIEWL
jgi:3-oxoacyl-[acyl-carrier-protein] synthase-3